MSRRARRNRNANAELNITAFMNLMVVLVPFLLITAVFSQMSILELNLPAGSLAQPQQPEKPVLELEVIIYKNRLEVADRYSGPIKSIPLQQGRYDYETLRKTLQAVKKRFSDVTNINLLLDERIAYDVLVQTMDTVKYGLRKEAGTEIRYQLFPDIAIGDAPPDQQQAVVPNEQEVAP